MKITKKSKQDSSCPGRNSNLTPSEAMSLALTWSKARISYRPDHRAMPNVNRLAFLEIMGKGKINLCHGVMPRGDKEVTNFTTHES
jgi:hypothetical protein